MSGSGRLALSFRLRNSADNSSVLKFEVRLQLIHCEFVSQLPRSILVSLHSGLAVGLLARPRINPIDAHDVVGQLDYETVILLGLTCSALRRVNVTRP